MAHHEWPQVYADLVDLLAGRKTARQREIEEDWEVFNHLLRYRIIDRNGNPTGESE